MTSKLKCPFCGKELKDQWVGQNVAHEYFDCPKCKMNGNPKLWRELTKTRQDLEQSEKCCSAWETQALDYKAETIALSGKLEITRKALEEIAKEHTGTDGKLYACSFTAQQALEQIEHKEQK